MPTIEAVNSLTLNELPAFLGELRELQAQAEIQMRRLADRGDPQSEAEGFLPVAEVASRLGYAEKTVRNLVSAGEFRQGEHYFNRRRGRLMFSWSAVAAWAMQSEPEQTESVVRVRRQSRGRVG